MAGAKFTISDEAIQSLVLDAKLVCDGLISEYGGGLQDEIIDAFEALLSDEPAKIFEVYAEADRTLCMRVNRGLRQHLIAQIPSELASSVN